MTLRKTIRQYANIKVVDFNANKFKPYEEIRKSLARKYKEEFFFGTKSLSEKPREGFSTWFFTDESKMEFYKK